MNKSLEGKAALVTGAAGAIGSDAVRVLLDRGARVCAVDADKHGLERLKSLRGEGDRLVVHCGDVTDETHVRSFVKHAMDSFGRIDFFFNNAGIAGPVHRIPEYPLDKFWEVINVNVVGVFLGMKYVIPVMRDSGGGSILNTSSIAGLTGTPGVAAYTASKHAVIGLTRCAAVEWGRQNVRINAICPGSIDSQMMRSLESKLATGSLDEIRGRLEASIPAMRYGTVEEISSVVAFLASEDARYMNGSIITVDGGYTAR